MSPAPCSPSAKISWWPRTAERSPCARSSPPGRPVCRWRTGFEDVVSRRVSGWHETAAPSCMPSPMPRVLAHPDLGIHAAAIAAAGSAVALHVRDRTAERRGARRVWRSGFSRSPGRPRHRYSSTGVQTSPRRLRPTAFSSPPPISRRRMRDESSQRGWIGRSVHTEDEAETAIDEGADYSWSAACTRARSHPGQPGRRARPGPACREARANR